jgi:hypothetical protein
MIIIDPSLRSMIDPLVFSFFCWDKSMASNTGQAFTYLTANYKQGFRCSVGIRTGAHQVMNEVRTCVDF